MHKVEGVPVNPVCAYPYFTSCYTAMIHELTDVCHDVAGSVKKVRIRRRAICETLTKHVLEPFALIRSKGIQMKMMSPGHARPCITGETT